MADSMNLYQKLAAITGEIGAIKKDGRNNEQKFDFIEYAAVAGRLRELFSKYGVIVIPRMQQAHRQQRTDVTSKYGAKGYAVLIDMSFNVVNADKPDEKFTVTWTGEAIDYGDKATNKAATSALKYYLMRQFNISEKGEDPDAESHELESATKKPAPKQAPAKSPEQHISEAMELDDEEPTNAPAKGTEATPKQLQYIKANFAKLGTTDRGEMLAYASAVIRRTVGSSKELTRGEAVKVIDQQLSEIEGSSDG